MNDKTETSVAAVFGVSEAVYISSLRSHLRRLDDAAKMIEEAQSSQNSAYMRFEATEKAHVETLALHGDLDDRGVFDRNDDVHTELLGAVTAMRDAFNSLMNLKVSKRRVCHNRFGDKSPDDYLLDLEVGIARTCESLRAALNRCRIRLREIKAGDE